MNGPDGFLCQYIAGDSHRQWMCAPRLTETLTEGFINIMIFISKSRKADLKNKTKDR